MSCDRQFPRDRFTRSAAAHNLLDRAISEVGTATIIRRSIVIAFVLGDPEIATRFH